MMTNKTTSGYKKTLTFLRGVTTRTVTHTILVWELYPEDIRLAIDMRWIRPMAADGTYTIVSRNLA